MKPLITIKLLFAGRVHMISYLINLSAWFSTNSQNCK